MIISVMVLSTFKQYHNQLSKYHIQLHCICSVTSTLIPITLHFQLQLLWTIHPFPLHLCSPWGAARDTRYVSVFLLLIIWRTTLIEHLVWRLRFSPPVPLALVVVLGTLLVLWKLWLLMMMVCTIILVHVVIIPLVCCHFMQCLWPNHTIG